MRICPSEVIPEGEYRIVHAGAASLVVARVGGRIHVVENVCGHQSRRLEGGALRTGPAGEPCIECPHHAMCFDLRDGHVVHDAGHVGMEGVKSYVAREEAGFVWVDLP